MSSVAASFLAAGGNRHPSAADVHDESGILAFGADVNVALWNPIKDRDSLGIEYLLAGHKDVVNVVKFFQPKNSNILYLLSGSADGEIRIWRQLSKPSSAFGPFVTCTTLSHDHKSLNSIAVLPQYNLFVSAAASPELKVWKCDPEAEDLAITLAQNIILAPKYFPLTVAAVSLEHSNSILLAVAGSKSFIQVFVSQTTNSEFNIVSTLTGHEGWIRSLEFVSETKASGDTEADILLASASQDKFIRLWRLHKGEHLPAAAKATKDPILGSLVASLSNRAYRFETEGAKYSITFEALLVGHEDWIYGCRWDNHHDSLRLLSASADSSLAIWQADAASGVWMCSVRLGEINAQKGATTATGSAGGFWAGLWLDQGNSVLSVGRTGSWRLWHRDEKEDVWQQLPAVGGHTRSVTGIAWAKDGSYLLSTSSDQTTRMYAASIERQTKTWHEFARPQIHGYDLSCVDTITNTQFISGADEKLLRVFDEPKAVADLLYETCGISNAAESDSLPEAANIPVLGLSNKAIEAEDGEETAVNDTAKSIEVDEGLIPRPSSQIHGVPLEDQLSRHLLWPEIEKLYGHGYEISAVAASNNGKLVATACRASSLDHAVIRLYNTSDWRAINPPLTAHTLTVTRLQFSPDDEYLLSVGRDRQCAVFYTGIRHSDGLAAELTAETSLVTSNPKAHSRMLLDAAWFPLETGYVFATAGRDKAIHVWRLEENDSRPKDDQAILTRLASISGPAPVTALSVLPQSVHGRYILAYGLEDGNISLLAFQKNDVGSGPLTSYDLAPGLHPARTVTQLAWRPATQEPGGTSTDRPGNFWELAVASEDCSVRILALTLDAVLMNS